MTQANSIAAALSSSYEIPTWLVGGIITIAVADSFSDALGIHLSQESDKKNSQKDIWTSTFVAFLTKLVFALTFLIPIFIFSLRT